VSPEPAKPELRASDADREAVVERLRTAAMEGRLDAEELEERVSAAYGARWESELERLTADVTPLAVSPPLPPVFVQPRTKRINPYAIASLVMSLLWIAWLGSIAAVVFGHIALRQIARSRDTESGSGLAIAGLALGYVGLAVLVLALMFVDAG
jgi:hypothetical protein